MQNQINRLAMKESKAVSFTEYYNEKSRDGRIRHWAVATATGNPPLPAPIRDVANLPRGSEIDAIKNHSGKTYSRLPILWLTCPTAMKLEC